MRRPPAAFVGRTAELDRARSVLERVPVLALCGVGGIGKSALARVLATEYGQAFSTSLVSGMSVEAVCDDALRVLGDPQSTVASLDIESVVRTLAARLDRSEALWVLEDIHLLEQDLRGVLLDGFAEHLDTGRLLTTSREVVPPNPRGPDRAELRLSSLSFSEGQALWTALDELHGPTARFEAAWGLVGGNPLLLRCAHAGAVDQLDPVADSVARLAPSQLRAAALLALHRRPLPAALLNDIADDAGAARRLMETMVVDIDATGLCSMHDVCADAVLRQLDTDTALALRRRLVKVLEDGAEDIATRALLMRQHLLALGEPKQLAAFLVEHAKSLVRAGAAGVLLDGLDALPAIAIDFEVAMVHARTLIRRLDFARAHRVLREIDERYPESAEVRATLGVVAYLRGRFAEAEVSLRFATTHEGISDAQRGRAVLSLAYCLTYQGRGSEARELLRATEHSGWTHEDFEIGTAFTWWLEERMEEAQLAMTPGFHEPDEHRRGLHASVLRPLFYATVRARNGRLAEWEAAFDASSAAAVSEQDVRLLVDRLYQRVEYLFCAGHLEQALLEAQRARGLAARGDYRIAAWSCSIWIGRCLHLLGRRREATTVLRQTRVAAATAGATTVVASVDRSQGYDAVVRVAGPVDLPMPRTDPCAYVALIRRAAEGKTFTIPADVAGIPGALTFLARSTAALTRGSQTEASQQLTAATQTAIEAGADPDFVASIRDAIGTHRMLTPEGTKLVAGQDDASVTLDATSHLLVYPGGELSVARRPVVRKLLYALAGSAGEVVDKEALVQAAWGRQYNPLQDDNPLKVNIRNLRKLVEGSGLSIEFEGAGYRLIAHSGFVFARA